MGFLLVSSLDTLHIKKFGVKKNFIVQSFKSNGRGARVVMIVDDLVNIEGVVVCIRQLGAKLVFCDILDPCERSELCISGFDKVPSKIHVGDLISACGKWEKTKKNTQMLRVNEIPHVKRYWKDIANGRHFVTLPAKSLVQSKEKNVHCKFWLAEKVCRKENCRYLHVPVDSEEYKLACKANAIVRNEKKSCAFFDKDDPHVGTKSKKSKKEKEFAKWLLGNFKLDKQSVILDVAGGRGKKNILFKLFYYFIFFLCRKTFLCSSFSRNWKMYCC